MSRSIAILGGTVAVSFLLSAVPVSAGFPGRLLDARKASDPASPLHWVHGTHRDCQIGPYNGLCHRHEWRSGARWIRCSPLMCGLKDAKIQKQFYPPRLQPPALLKRQPQVTGERR